MKYIILTLVLISINCGSVRHQWKLEDELSDCELRTARLRQQCLKYILEKARTDSINNVLLDRIDRLRAENDSLDRINRNIRMTNDSLFTEIDHANFADKCFEDDLKRIYNMLRDRW